MGYRLINPYTIYFISFTIGLVLYAFHWSGYFPPLEPSLLTFLCISFCVCLSIAWFIYKKNRPFITIAPTPATKQIATITLIIYILWMIEFIYAGGIPLLFILFGKSFNYRTFGIPSLHVFVVTFSSFYTSYLFHAFLASKKRIILFFCILNLFAALLIMNRGMLLTNLSTLSFIYILFQPSNKKHVTATKLAGALGMVVILFFLFGALGTVRVSHELKRVYDRSLVYEIGNATDSFKKSVIPSELFWGYLYIASPLANLQHNINHSTPEISGVNFLLLINYEFLPDAASKRISTQFTIEAKKNYQIAENLNASTIYSGSYTYWGWPGMISIFIALVTLPLVLKIPLLRESDLCITTFAIINTLYVFSIFDNMLAFTGFSFQLAYPFALVALRKTNWLSGNKN